jgi:hypothetical protein
MRNSKKKIIDIENLSAYLDDQLQPEEKAKLQSRLSNEAELRQQLEDLRQTRAVLRSTPQVRRPRSFTLTPEMVQQQRFVFQAMRFSRLVATVATVVFAFVFAGQMFFSRGLGFSAMSPAGNSVAMDEQAASDADLAEPLLAESEDDSANMAQMAEEEMESAAMEEPAEEAMEEPAEEGAAMLPQATPPPPPAEDDMAEDQDNADIAAASEPSDDEITQEPGGGGGLPPATPTSDAAIEPRTTDQEKTDEGERVGESAEEGPMFMAAPTEMLGEADGVEKIADEDMPVDGDTVQRGPRFSTIALVEGGLVALAVLAGVLSLYFQRKLK